MEHRWGERVEVDLPVRITAHPFAVAHGKLIDMSVSGASLHADVNVRLLSRIQVLIEMPRKMRRNTSPIAAYVTRSGKSGIGIEWCEFAPPLVSELLATLATRRYRRSKRPVSAVGMLKSRLSAPLLKHGL